MQRGTSVADPQLPVELTEDEKLERQFTLANKVGYRESLVESAKADAKKWKAQIEEVDAEIARLARVIREGYEDRAQMDLFANDALPKDEAARRLAEVAARAAKHPFVASETAIDTCAREGCGAQAGGEVHVAPPPAEPHTFAPDGTGEGKCWACGSGKDDPVHVEPAAAPDAPSDPSEAHAYAQAPEEAGRPPVCAVCGEDENDPRHHVEELLATITPDTDLGLDKPEAATAGPDTETTPGTVPPTESVEIAKGRVTGDPAFDFPDSDPPPNVIRTHPLGVE